ncbi:Clathrin light chain, partial [Spiromyces aspiralis]
LEDGGFIEEWREKQQAIIAERDEGARKRHDETVEKARQEIDKFYDEYNEKRDKRVQENRANQEIELQQATTGNVWERTLRQIDIVSKSVSSTQAAEVKSVRSPPASSRSGQTQSPFSLEARGGAFGSRARESVEAGSSIQIRDTTRMRELLQDLKKDPKAPGIEAKS